VPAPLVTRAEISSAVVRSIVRTPARGNESRRTVNSGPDAANETVDPDNTLGLSTGALADGATTVGSGTLVCAMIQCRSGLAAAAAATTISAAAATDTGRRQSGTTLVALLAASRRRNASALRGGTVMNESDWRTIAA